MLVYDKYYISAKRLRGSIKTIQYVAKQGQMLKTLRDMEELNGRLKM